MRSTSLRLSAREGDPAFGQATDAVTELARQFATVAGIDVWVSTATDQDAPDEHPERDALLALADKWSDESTTAGAQSWRGEALHACAEQLVRLIATLNL